MSINQTASRIVQATARYEAFLATLSDADFQRNPADGMWSYAEVYSHIFEANLISLLALEKCVKGTAEEVINSNKKSINISYERMPALKLYLPNLLQFHKENLEK